MAISEVQSNENHSTTSVTTLAVTLPTGVSLGNLLVVSAATGNNATTITGPTGWTRATINQPAGASATIETSIWWLVVGAGQVGQTSWTFSLSASHTEYLIVEEWHSTNGWPANPVDVFANGDTIGTPVAATAISSGTTATTAQASELWVASLAYKGSAQTESGITAGWSVDLESTLAGNNTMTMLYNVVSATGAATCSYNIGTAQFWAGCVVTFKENPASSNPILTTSPTSLSFSAGLGGSNPASLNDTLSEINGFATAWTSSISYTSGTGWLSLSPTSGSLAANGTATITVSAALGALAAGTYTATITFTATTGGNTAAIAVSFTITAPALSVSPTSHTYTATAGGANPTSQNSTLTEINGVATNWTSSISYGSGSGWLTLTPSSGSLVASGHVSIAFSPATGSLVAGTYTATVTLTATTGGATATVSISFTVNAGAVNQYSITLEGQDITRHVYQLSVVVDDTLGQGSGAGSSGATQGRAATVKFSTDLGPMNQALGAGQAIPGGGPYLIRQGEIIITDNTGTIVFGGYATKYTDVTTSQIGHTKQPFTAVEGIDYSTSLQRTLVNETFSAVTDVYIIQYVLQKYAPWIKLDYLPTTPAYTFAIKNFRNQTLEQVLQTVAGITGFLIYVDYLKYIHYVSPTVASSAPYNISSAPDFITTFPAAVEEFLVDDNSAINRVFFYGGTRLSNDFWQDVSGLANGSNLVFVMAFYGSPLSTGGYGVTVNGVAYVVGTANGQSAKDQFISQGGTAQVLIDPGSRTATFDTGLAPASGSLVLIGYRYSYPLSLILTDENSHKFFGDPYLDGNIDDNTIFDVATAIQRCKVLLAQQSFGLTTLKLTLWNHPGVQSGMVIHVFNGVRGINGTYLVQDVQIEPIGGGNFVYHFTLGAWNWGLIDFLLKLPTLSTFSDNQTETQEIVDIQQLLNSVQVHDSWATSVRTGPYYARATPVGDGHDAYPGLSTISS